MHAHKGWTGPVLVITTFLFVAAVLTWLVAVRTPSISRTLVNKQPSHLGSVCGPWAVKRCCDLLGVPATFTAVERLLPSDHPKHSLLEIKQVLEGFGFEVSGRRETLPSLALGPFPCVIHLDHPNHFVVAASADAGAIHLFDCQGSHSEVPIKSLASRWSGTVLRVAKPHRVTARPSGPRIEFDNLCVDVGRIPMHAKPVTLSVPVRNTGSRNLVIKQVRSSCPCISSAPRSLIIPPDSAGVISLQYSPASTRGTFIRDVVVQTNDPQFSAVGLIVTGLGMDRPRAIPETIRLGQVCAGTSVSTSVFVDSGGSDGALPISDIKSDLNNVEFTQVPAGMAVQRANHLEGLAQVVVSGRVHTAIEMTYTPQFTDIGPIKGVLKIGTANTDVPPLEVRIEGEVISPLKAYPPVLTVLDAHRSQRHLATKAVLLTFENGKPFLILDIECNVDGVAITYPKENVSGIVALQLTADWSRIAFEASPAIAVRILAVESSNELMASIPIRLID